VSFAAITFCVVAPQRVFVVVYFVTDSVRKLLNTPSYNIWSIAPNFKWVTPSPLITNQIPTIPVGLTFRPTGCSTVVRRLPSLRVTPVLNLV
jgi:hypothetical protein